VTPQLALSGWHRRRFSSVSGADAADAGAASPPAADKAKVQALADDIARQVAEGVADMRKEFGDQHTEKARWYNRPWRRLQSCSGFPGADLHASPMRPSAFVTHRPRTHAPPTPPPPPHTPLCVQVWMTEYYRHRAHKYFVPAVSLMSGEAGGAGGGAGGGGGAPAVPSMAAKNAVFLAHVLRDVPPEQAVRHIATLSMTRGVDVTFLLAILRQAGTPATGAVYDRLVASIRRMGTKELVAAGQAVAAAPLTPVDQWPIPFLDPAFAADWKKKVYPFEVLGKWRDVGAGRYG
jgi:hypothetical protein